METEGLIVQLQNCFNKKINRPDNLVKSDIKLGLD